MTKEEILKTGLFDGGAEFQPHWHVDSCRQIDSANAAAMYPTVSVCKLWHGTELNEEHDKSYLQVRFDSDNKLVAWAYIEFVDRKSPQHPRDGWANSSDVIREVRQREAGLARLGIPDTEDDHQANWYFVSQSEKNKNGFPKILEMASLTVGKQGDYWAITIDYSDESKK